jgi:hypothetical protein
LFRISSPSLRYAELGRKAPAFTNPVIEVLFARLVVGSLDCSIDTSCFTLIPDDYDCGSYRLLPADCGGSTPDGVRALEPCRAGIRAFVLKGTLSSLGRLTDGIALGDIPLSYSRFLRSIAFRGSTRTSILGRSYEVLYPSGI